MRDRIGRRIVTGVLVGVPVMLAALNAFTLLPQSSRFGHEPSAPAGPMAEWSLVAALAVAMVSGVLAARAVSGGPVVTVTDAPSQDAPRLAGAAEPSASLTWEGSAGSRAPLLVLLVPTGLVAALGAVEAASGGGFGLLLGLGLFVVLVDVLVAGMLFIRVRVDADGLVVRSAVPGLRSVRRLRLHVPLAQIREARVVDVHPLGDFGGWGYRVGTGGRSGFVLRAGEALEVHRGDGGRLVVTVEGAGDAAATLNSLLDRVRG
jgi:hypothetical protein